MSSTITPVPADRRAGDPAPRSRVWRGADTVAADVSVTELTDRLAQEAQRRAWWWVPRHRSALTETARLFDLDDFAVEDVLSDREPPKLDVVGSTVIVIGALVRFDAQTDELHKDRVALLATDRMLAVIADPPAAVPLIRRLADSAGGLAADGVPAGLHVLVDLMVHTQGQALLAIADAADELTTSLFDDKPMNRADQLQAFRIRQAIAGMRRVSSPFAELAADLAGAAGRPAADDDPVAALLHGSTARRFEDVCDHARHAARETDTVREMLSSAYETNLALSDVHLNVIMKKLSAWAAIIAVPTLVTGFFGMNVPYPGFGETRGFVVGTVVIVSAATGLFVLFKRNGWL
ncbi:magnesium transporter CorA family protein [Nakamurella sp.]|uniref:magnesium transporter CorA family protein n=1 Tax=Nakamurella sp. TaxID=1869182 RepID=UPI003784EF61